MIDDSPAAGLAATVRALRAELTEAMSEGREQDLLFELGDINLEFQVAVSKDAAAEGGVRFWVVTLGAKGSMATSATHRLALTLRPVMVDDLGVPRPARISDRLTYAPE